MNANRNIFRKRMTAIITADEIVTYGSRLTFIASGGHIISIGLPIEDHNDLVVSFSTGQNCYKLSIRRPRPEILDVARAGDLPALCRAVLHSCSAGRSEIRKNAHKSLRIAATTLAGLSHAHAGALRPGVIYSHAHCPISLASLKPASKNTTVLRAEARTAFDRLLELSRQTRTKLHLQPAAGPNLCEYRAAGIADFHSFSPPKDPITRMRNIRAFIEHATLAGHSRAASESILEQALS